MKIDKFNQKFDFLVIGSGVGGLFTGALLASAGHRVGLVERHYEVGGYGHTFERNGFKFCAQLHYLWNCRHDDDGGRIFRHLGLGDQIRFVDLNPDGFDHLCFPGFRYEVVRGFKRNTERLAHRFPDHREGLQAYYQLISELNQELLHLPLDMRWWDLMLSPLRHPRLLRYKTWTVARLFDQLGFPTQLRSILAGQSGNLLVPPRDASLIVHAGMVAGYDAGACVPVCSYKEIFEGLENYIKRQPGCDVFRSTEIVRLDHKRNILRRALDADGNAFSSDAFIFNGDPKLVQTLLTNYQFPAAYSRKLDYSYSTSSMTVYLGLKGIDLRRYGFGDWNLWHYSEDSIETAFDRQIKSDDHSRPSIFVSTPTLHSKIAAVAPTGCDQLVLCSACSYDSFAKLRANNRTAYLSKKRFVADRMIDQIETHYLPELRKHIEVEVIGTPTTNAHWVHAPRGNAYGADLIPANIHPGKIGFRTPFANLYLVGATAGAPSFAAGMHFALLTYRALTGRTVP